MIRQVTAADRDLSIILPGTWAWVPLGDDEAMRKRVTALVKAQVGQADRLAGRRRQSIDELIQTAQSAREAGALSFALSLELIPGVPFPGSMLMTKVDWPAAATAAEPGARLAQAFPDAQILQQRTGAVARHAEFFQQRVGESTTSTLRCEYWMPVPDASRLLCITISAPTTPEPELFTQLFDSVVDSVTWTSEPIPVQLED